MEDKIKWAIPYHSKEQQNENSKEKVKKKKKFKVGERYVLKSILPVGTYYKTYKAIDVVSRKFVIVYIRPSIKEKIFGKIIKEELRQKITPPVLWSGTQTFDQNTYDVEVHARYGPSLEQIMIKYKQKVNQKTFYLLAYHLLKLLDKIDTAGYVTRNLSLKTITLSESSIKNDLFLINTFDLERKGEDCNSNYDMKYCSIGCHLKLRTCSKDTLESMCYCLMDFYQRGNLFDYRLERQKDFLEAKHMLNPEGIPLVFLEFYEYIKNLGHTQEIKFTQWKIKFKKCIPQLDFHRPYQWISLNERMNEQDSENTQKQEQPITPLDFLFSKKRSSVRKNRLFQEIENENLIQEEDTHQIEDEKAEAGKYIDFKERYLMTDSFFKNR